MPLKTKPLNNYCLIEVVRENEEVSRMEENESMSFGKLVDFHVETNHMTASAGYKIYPDDVHAKGKELKAMIGKIVRWEEYAEGGQTFEEDGKTYALIPFWRLISVTE